MEKDEEVIELTEKAKMQQSLYSALRCLDEWDWEDISAVAEAARDLLRKAAQDIGKQVESLQDDIIDGR